MRIAVAVHGYPPAAAGGVERVAAEQAEALVRRGHEVFVFTRDTAAPGPEGSMRRDRVGDVSVSRVVVAEGARPSFADYYEGGFLDDAFRRFLREVRPEVLHVQHLVTMSTRLMDVARDEGVATVLSLHDFYYLCHRLFRIDATGERCPGSDAGARCVACLAEHGVGEAVRARFDSMARSLARCDVITAPSASLAARYAEELPFLRDRIEILEPGLENLPSPRRTETARADPLRLVFIGTWMPHKGLDVLIDALESLPAGAFDLVVHGEEVDPAWSGALRARTADRRVRWAGRFDAANLDRVFSSVDALVLPSRCDESWSRVVREARAAGLAVVAPRVGGPADWLEDGVDALLVEPGSVASLAGALERLRVDHELCARLSIPARDLPTVDEAAAKLEVISNDAVESRRRARAAGPTRVTVAYVTKNGDRWLRESLAAVRAQRGDFELVEILAVDSGSTDGTLALLRDAGARVLSIAPKEFGHGRTRNLAAREAVGDVVVFLTQDAAPADDRWLAGLVRTLEEDPMCAAAWSLHVPRPDCHPMEWRMLAEHPPFRAESTSIQQARGNATYAQNADAWCSLSNNAAAYRRGALLRVPFPDVSFGEDRGWARTMLDAGWRTVLVRESIVRHSHSYPARVHLRRNFDHWRAMSEELGHVDDFGLVDGWRAALREARADCAYWADRTGESLGGVAARWALPALFYHLAAFTGRWLGSRSRSLPRGVPDRISMHTLSGRNGPRE